MDIMIKQLVMVNMMEMVNHLSCYYDQHFINCEGTPEDQGGEDEH